MRAIGQDIAQRFSAYIFMRGWVYHNISLVIEEDSFMHITGLQTIAQPVRFQARGQTEQPPPAQPRSRRDFLRRMTLTAIAPVAPILAGKMAVDEHQKGDTRGTAYSGILALLGGLLSAKVIHFAWSPPRAATPKVAKPAQTS